MVLACCGATTENLFENISFSNITTVDKVHLFETATIIRAGVNGTSP